MIPKIIHYCWFGEADKPDLALKCIESWKKFCPDYVIIEWNENNYDISKNFYMQQAYNAKKWGFVPDFARLDIIYNNGGIYLDTDVEIIKPIDELLNLKGFAGMERIGVVNLGLGFGAEAKHPVVKEMMDSYKNRVFCVGDGVYDLTPSPKIQTSVLQKHGLDNNNSIQFLDYNFTVFPTEYFCPKSFKTGELNITNNTFSIHHFDASWVGEKNKYMNLLRWKLSKIIGYSLAKDLALLIATMKYDGLLLTIKKIFMHY